MLIGLKDSKMTTKKIICNKCGKTFNEWDTHEDFSIYKHLGYGTKYDGDYLQLDICCGCMEKLIEECAISPITENLGTF